MRRPTRHRPRSCGATATDDADDGQGRPRRHQLRSGVLVDAIERRGLEQERPRGRAFSPARGTPESPRPKRDGTALLRRTICRPS